MGTGKGTPNLMSPSGVYLKKADQTKGIKGRRVKAETLAKSVLGAPRNVREYGESKSEKGNFGL